MKQGLEHMWSKGAAFVGSNQKGAEGGTNKIECTLNKLCLWSTLSHESITFKEVVLSESWANNQGSVEFDCVEGMGVTISTDCQPIYRSKGLEHLEGSVHS